MMHDEHRITEWFSNEGATTLEEEHFLIGDWEFARDQVSSPSIHPYRERFGVTDDDRHDELVVADGSVAMLTTEPGVPAVVVPRIVRTYSIDEFRAWMTMPEFTEGATARKHYPAPEREWSGRIITHPEELTSQEQRDIELARMAYIFGTAGAAASYREVLERLYAPFDAAVYALRRMEIRTGARLVVAGLPAILLVDDLEIYPEGRIEIYTACRAGVGRLTKRAAPGHSAGS